MEKVWDVIIVGAGPAGLTAGIYTARHGHSTLILHSGKIGGRALEAHRIENYPGFPQGLTGPELMKLFEEQATRFGAEIRLETIIGLSDAGNYKIVSTRSGTTKARPSSSPLIQSSLLRPRGDGVQGQGRKLLRHTRTHSSR
jgi:thioredoxin reductase (NADPH)